MQQLFPKTTKPVQKFDPAVNTVWFAACPVGHYTLENLSHDMTSRARINPLMTNHCIRATSITVLSAANVERRHTKEQNTHSSGKTRIAPIGTIYSILLHQVNRELNLVQPINTVLLANSQAEIKVCERGQSPLIYPANKDIVPLFSFSFI